MPCDGMGELHYTLLMHLYLPISYYRGYTCAQDFRQVPLTLCLGQQNSTGMAPYSMIQICQICDVFIIL